MLLVLQSVEETTSSVTLTEPALSERSVNRWASPRSSSKLQAVRKNGVPKTTQKQTAC